MLDADAGWSSGVVTMLMCWWEEVWTVVVSVVAGSCFKTALNHAPWAASKVAKEELAWATSTGYGPIRMNMYVFVCACAFTLAGWARGG